MGWSEHLPYDANGVVIYGTASFICLGSLIYVGSIFQCYFPDGREGNPLFHSREGGDEHLAAPVAGKTRIDGRIRKAPEVKNRHDGASTDWDSKRHAL